MRTYQALALLTLGTLAACRETGEAHYLRSQNTAGSFEHVSVLRETIRGNVAKFTCYAENGQFRGGSFGLAVYPFGNRNMDIDFRENCMILLTKGRARAQQQSQTASWEDDYFK